MSKDCKFPENHMCHGPLFKIIYNNQETVYCSESIKRLIKLGNGVSIIEKIPRKSLLKEQRRKRFGDDLFFDEKI